ncbi:MAG: hypothetical protein JW764_03780 [Chlorobiaceae bacterium]|nr:hypothetical protein [Chlorobiaceae bacterium]
MNYSFKTLWNAMFVFVGPLWFALVWMIWDSGQLRTPHDQTLYFALVIPGFILIYLSGFLIQKRHSGKMQNMQS